MKKYVRKANFGLTCTCNVSICFILPSSDGKLEIKKLSPNLSSCKFRSLVMVEGIDPSMKLSLFGQERIARAAIRIMS